jgi:hypothetical protein
MPVYKLLEEMSYEELQCWFEYFEKRPIGWREDDRTYKLLQAQGVKAKGTEIFRSLAAISSQGAKLEDGRINESFKASFMYQKLIGSVSGDKIT